VQYFRLARGYVIQTRLTGRAKMIGIIAALPSNDFSQL
jgi:hypothetical protein